MKRKIMLIILIFAMSNSSYALFGEDGFLSGMASFIAKWGTGAIDVMGKIAVGDLSGAGKKVDSLLKSDEEREQKKIELLQSIGTTLELQKKENEGWFKYIGRKYDEGKDVAKETLQAINDFERTKQKWQEYSQKSSKWLELFVNGDLAPEKYLNTFADLEDIYCNMTVAEKNAVENRIVGQQADINFDQATEEELDEVSKTLDSYGVNVSKDIEDIIRMKKSRDQMTIAIASLNYEIVELNDQKKKLVEKVNTLRTADNSLNIYLGEERVSIDPVQKEQLISSLKLQIANCDQLIKLRHDEMENKRLKLTKTISEIKQKQTSIHTHLDVLNMKMLTAIIGKKTQIKWAQTLDQATLQMMQQQVSDELSGLFSMSNRDWSKQYLTKGLLLGQINKQDLKIDVKEVLGLRTYQYMKSKKLKELLVAFNDLERQAEPEIKKSVKESNSRFWMKKGS